MVFTFSALRSVSIKYTRVPGCNMLDRAIFSMKYLLA